MHIPTSTCSLAICFSDLENSGPSAETVLGVCIYVHVLGVHIRSVQYKSNKSLRSVLELRSFYGATVPKKTIGTRPTDA